MGRGITLKGDAAKAFIESSVGAPEGKDDLAYEVRRLADEFERERKDVSVRLDAHIKRAIARAGHENGAR